MDKTQPHPLFKLATELGPLLVFFFVNAKFNLFAATGAFMVAIVAAMIASYVVTRHVPIMAIVTGVIVLVFGTLTLVLHDETFIKVKPTIIYGLFAAILGGGLLFGRSFIAVMFDQMFNLTPQGWRILTLRWALFFAGMAVLNEIVWRTQSTDFWVNFKVFGVTPITDDLRHRPDAADQALRDRAGVAGDERGRGGGCAEGVIRSRVPDALQRHQRVHARLDARCAAQSRDPASCQMCRRGTWAPALQRITYALRSVRGTRAELSSSPSAPSPSRGNNSVLADCPA